MCSFAIDGATLHYESKEKMVAGKEYPVDYGVLSDKVQFCPRADLKEMLAIVKYEKLKR